MEPYIIAINNCYYIGIHGIRNASINVNQIFISALTACCCEVSLLCSAYLRASSFGPEWYSVMESFIGFHVLGKHVMCHLLKYRRPWWNTVTIPALYRIALSVQPVSLIGWHGPGHGCRPGTPATCRSVGHGTWPIRLVRSAASRHSGPACFIELATQLNSVVYNFASWRLSLVFKRSRACQCHSLSVCLSAG